MQFEDGNLTSRVTPNLPTWKANIWGSLPCCKKHCPYRGRILDHPEHLNQNLKRYTYWYKFTFSKSDPTPFNENRRVPCNSKLLGKLLHLAHTDVEEYKAIFQTVDSVLIQAYMSEPELAMKPNWAYTDKLIRGCLLSCIKNRTSFIKRYKNQCKILRKFLLSNLQYARTPRLIAEGVAFKKKLNKLVYREFRFLCYHTVFKLSDKAFSCLLSPKERRVYMQRIAHLFAYRSTGLATTQMRAESYDKFRKIVSLPETGKENFVKKLEVRKLLRRLFSRLGKESKRVKAMRENLTGASIFKFSKISVTNSGCLESSVAKGGKRAHYKNVINQFYNDGKTIRVYDLYTGQMKAERKVQDYLANKNKVPFDGGEEYGGELAVNVGSNFGQILQDIAIMDLFEDRIPKDVNLSIIAEAGKARTVSSGSAMLALAEYPISHVLNEILKQYPQTMSGMKASNHAYNFFRSMLPVSKDWTAVYDLSTATDYGPWSVGRAILEALTEELMLPPAYMKKLCDLAFSGRVVKSQYGPTFESLRGWPMGEQLTKAILTFCQLLTEMATDHKGLVQSSYVGDDGIVKYDTKAKCELHLENLQRFGLLLSPEDTWVALNSPSFFCEKILDYIPPELCQLQRSDLIVNRWGEVDYSKSTVDIVDKMILSGKSLPYVDCVPTRLLNAVQKERAAHSSSSTGKVEMLANIQRFNDIDSMLLFDVIAPWLQRTILSRQNPSDIIPRTLCGRGLYVGSSSVEFFKERVPPSLAVGCYLAHLAFLERAHTWRGDLMKPSVRYPDINLLNNNMFEVRELTDQEERFLFGYHMVREGFRKSHDRSMSTRIPIKTLQGLYTRLRKSGVIVRDIPDGKRKYEYMLFKDFVKEIISAYDEANYYLELDNDKEEETLFDNKDSEEQTLRELMLEEDLPDYGEIVYEAIAAHAVFEKTRGIQKYYLEDSKRGWIPMSYVREIRIGWLKTNTNFNNEIFDPRSPDRDPAEQSAMHYALGQIAWALELRHRTKIATLIEDGIVSRELKAERDLLKVSIEEANSFSSESKDDSGIDNLIDLRVEEEAVPAPKEPKVFNNKYYYRENLEGGNTFLSGKFCETTSYGIGHADNVVKSHIQGFVLDKHENVLAVVASDTTKNWLLSGAFRSVSSFPLRGEYVLTKGGLISSGFISEAILSDMNNTSYRSILNVLHKIPNLIKVEGEDTYSVFMGNDNVNHNVFKSFQTVNSIHGDRVSDSGFRYVNHTARSVDTFEKLNVHRRRRASKLVF
jgi:hypothetical protein